MNNDETIEDVLNTYIAEYNTDVQFDEFTLREMELKVPGLKNKWSGRKAIHKARYYQICDEIDNFINDNIDRIIKKSDDVGKKVNKIGAESIIKKSREYKDLITKKNNLKVLTDYFESCEKNIMSLGFDVKNLVETIKLDQM